MKTFKPTTNVRVKAIQFDELSETFLDKYPLRYIIEDDALNKVRYELWVEKKKQWREILPQDWIILEEDGIGFYPCPAAEFKEKYEEI